MASVLSVNIGPARPTDHSDVGVTGIGKHPVAAGFAVAVTAPAARGIGGSGLAGDAVCDKRHHGGPDQAVYAYAREDLDGWQRELGRELRSGMFGENLTTIDADISNTVIGERWRVGDGLVLEVSMPRIPCRTFAGWIGDAEWIKRFTRRAIPGTYFRVITRGSVRPGDPITVVFRPDHDVTVAKAFRAFTLEPELLPDMLVADALPAASKDLAARRTAAQLGRA